jgi:release factor glutamine methyltransferase
VRRRLKHEPVQYILGEVAFRELRLAVDRRVLIPRPETELLVDVALDIQPEKALEVGTGSGAIALAIANELPGASVTATDSSESALVVARANAARLGLGERVRFEPGTLAAGESELLVANLPYVTEAEWDGLGPEIREFEPREALVAGPTGLEAIEGLLEAVARRGLPAAIALEVGAGQAAAVGELIRAAGFAGVGTRRDLAGIERVVTATA